MKYLGSFGGPSAPWIDEDDSWSDEQDFGSVLSQVSRSLARALEYRVARLQEQPSLDLVVQEIRAQIAAAAAVGQFAAIAELSDLMMYLQSLAEAEKEPVREGTEKARVDVVLPDWDATDE